MLDSKFAFHFLTGGLTIAALQTIMSNHGGHLAGFIYGSLPITYIYLYILGSAFGTQYRKNFAKASLYTVIAWCVFVLMTYIFANLPVGNTLIISFVIFYLRSILLR